MLRRARKDLRNIYETIRKALIEEEVSIGSYNFNADRIELHFSEESADALMFALDCIENAAEAIDEACF